jgi:hypothetical protein
LQPVILYPIYRLQPVIFISDLYSVVILERKLKLVLEIKPVPTSTVRLIVIILYYTLYFFSKIIHYSKKKTKKKNNKQINKQTNGEQIT